MELEQYMQYHETKVHERPGFAYNTYLCTIPLDFPRVDLHWHEQMEIIYVKKGSGNVRVGSQIWRVCAGSIVPIMPGELHAISGIDGIRMEYENIIFSLSLLESSEGDEWCHANVIKPLSEARLNFPRPINPGTGYYEEVSLALDRADSACSRRDGGYSLIVRGCLFQFLHALYTNRIVEEKRPSTLHDEEIKKVMAFVRDHLSERIRVEDAAAVTGYSSAHFMRIFHEETGQTFVEYLNDYRLNYASYLLRESSEPVTEVARKCGFDNFSYFSRLFKKRYGQPPHRYRTGKSS